MYLLNFKCTKSTTLILITLPQSVLDEVHISEQDVYKALMSLNNSKAMGIGNTGPTILKNGALAFYFPSHHSFSLTLTLT